MTQITQPIEQFLNVMNSLEKSLDRSINSSKKLNLTNEELQKNLLQPMDDKITQKYIHIFEYNDLVDLEKEKLSYIKDPNYTTYKIFLDYIKLKDLQNEYEYLTFEENLIQNSLKNPKTCKEYYYLPEETIKRSLIQMLIENTNRKQMLPKKLDLLIENLERIKSIQKDLIEIQKSKKKLEEILCIQNN